MEASPLEEAVRAYFRAQMAPTVGRSRHLTPEAIASVIDMKTAEALVVLRETLAEHDMPTEDGLFRAQMEVSHRTIECCVGQLRNAEIRDPRWREIAAALADDAEINLAELRTIGPDVTQAQLDEVTKGLIERMKAMNERFGFKMEQGPLNGGDAGGTPTPQ